MPCFPRGVETPLDAELFHGAGEPESTTPDANGADKARWVREDAIGGSGNVISSRSTNIRNHGVEFLVRVFILQPVDGLVNVIGLDRAASRAVDAKNHRLGILVPEGPLHCGNQVIGAGILVTRYYALHVHQCRVCPAGTRRWHIATERRLKKKQQRDQVQKTNGLEKDPQRRLRRCSACIESMVFSIRRHSLDPSSGAPPLSRTEPSPPPSRPREEGAPHSASSESHSDILTP